MFAQGFADRLSERGEKRVCHGAADDEELDFAQQICQQVELGRDLGAADDGGDRAGRVSQCLVEGVEFSLHAAAGIGGQFVRKAFRRGMRPMCHGKGIVDENIAEPRKGGRESRVVGFLSLMKARVLQTEKVAVAH